MSKLVDVWRPIPGYPKLEISILGRIRNKRTKRIVKEFRRNGRMCVRLRKGIIFTEFYLISILDEVFPD